MLSAVDLVLRLPHEIPGLKTLYFKRAVPIDGLKKRLDGAGLPSAEQLAEAPRDRWEEAISLLLEHSKPATPFPVSAQSLGEDLPALLEACPPDEALCLCSLCEILADPGRWHIPMMDFQAPADDSTLDLAGQMLRSGDPVRGYLLASGRSFHFCGTSILPEPAWRRFMARCLLLPFTDVRHIGHRLLDGLGSLRLNTTANKPMEPRIVRGPW